MNVAYLSIGTNMGERAVNLQDAVKALLAHDAIQVNAVSSIYETAAVGFTDQADFLNIAVRLSTTLTADALLTVCQSIENELGRIREFRWGPRIIDLDILLYNQENIEAEHLLVPHPRMYERAFVLVPLVEVTTENTPQLHQAQQSLATMDVQKEGITIWKQIDTVEEFVHFAS